MTGYNLLTPGHRSIRKDYENVAALRDQGVLNEMALGNAPPTSDLWG
jgi:hypothetical protein